MKWIIKVEECCGTLHCAKAWDNERNYKKGYYPEWRESVSSHEYNHIEPVWDAEAGTFVDSPEAKIALHKGRLEALKELLKTLMESANLSQEDADKLLEKWLAENPDPELEVSQALEAVGQPIPVALPQKVIAP